MCQPTLRSYNMYANEYCLQFNAIYFHDFQMKIDAACPFADQSIMFHSCPHLDISSLHVQ